MTDQQRADLASKMANALLKVSKDIDQGEAVMCSVFATISFIELVMQNCAPTLLHETLCLSAKTFISAANEKITSQGETIQ
jgi:hypothetical protein